MLLAQQLATLVPDAWQGLWLPHIVRYQHFILDRFYAFDAAWYWQIGTQGYDWNPSRPDVEQDVAFFPLWPLLTWLITQTGASPLATGWCSVMLAATFGLAAIIAFDSLSCRLLPPPAARIATWLFALYPAGTFLLQSYPTGLMNLLTVLALLAMLNERFLAAAACSALLTALGPLGLGTAIAVCTCAAWNEVTRFRASHARAAAVWRPLARLAALGLLSISGLLAFLAWQHVMLGDALAFMTAQEGWEPQISWLARLPRALLQVLIIPDFAAAIVDLKHLAHTPSLVWLELALEKSLNSTVQGLSLIGLLACLRFAPWPIILQGAFTEAIFIWFHGAIRPGNSTMRLLYCAIGMFLGAAWLLQHRPRLAACTIGMSACLLAGGAFLMAAGHHFT